MKRTTTAKLLDRAVDVLTVLILAVWCQCQFVHADERSGTPVPADAERPPSSTDWKPLFDGRTLQNWKVTEFGGEGEVEVKDGSVELGFGAMLTGITYTESFPDTEYEIRLEAKRLDGIDFFCGLTFPVQQSHCSLIVGGWAGAVVGLSCIDGRDASENDTTRYMAFDDNRWYRIRVRVTEDRIRAWIDDRQVVNQELRDRQVSLRVECDLCKPLGIAAWQTRAALRKIEYRRLKREGEKGAGVICRNGPAGASHK